MITQDHYLAILARITPNKPLSIDKLLFEDTPQADQNVAQDAQTVPLYEGLWDRTDDGVSYIGIRVSEAMTDESAIAIRLASAALERGVVPIILSTIEDCPLRRYGFRVEDISAPTQEARDRLEQEVSALWSLAIVVDAADVALLG
jgi:hypothetical protein